LEVAEKLLKDGIFEAQTKLTLPITKPLVRPKTGSVPKQDRQYCFQFFKILFQLSFLFRAWEKTSSRAEQETQSE